MPIDQDRTSPTAEVDREQQPATQQVLVRHRPGALPARLLAQARQEDADHRAVHQRPISADTLRKRLRIGTKRSRQLVALVRAEAQAHASAVADNFDAASEAGVANAA